MKPNQIDFMGMHQQAGEPGCNYYCNPANGAHAYIMYSNVPYSTVYVEVLQREYQALGILDVEVVDIHPCREPGPFNSSGLMGNLSARNPMIVWLRQKEM